MTSTRHEPLVVDSVNNYKAGLTIDGEDSNVDVITVARYHNDRWELQPGSYLVSFEPPMEPNYPGWITPTWNALRVGVAVQPRFIQSRPYTALLEVNKSVSIGDDAVLAEKVEMVEDDD